MSTPVPLARRLAAVAAWRGYPFSKASIWPEVLTLMGSLGVSLSALSGMFLAGVIAANLAMPAPGHAREDAWAHKVVVHTDKLDYAHYAHTPEDLRAGIEAVHGQPAGSSTNTDTGEP